MVETQTQVKLVETKGIMKTRDGAFNIDDIVAPSFFVLADD